MPKSRVVMRVYNVSREYAESLLEEHRETYTDVRYRMEKRKNGWAIVARWGSISE